MELVHFNALDGLRLDGVLASPTSPKGIVVHIHGKCGNFYQNDFIRNMLAGYPASDLAFLAFNNRGHDCIAEGYFVDKLRYVGGSTECFEECVLDIAAGIDFAASVAPSVFLQGHSNGCEKIIYALSQQELRARRVSGIILISPSDSHALQKLYIAPESIDTQVERLTPLYESRLDELLPDSEYGIRVQNKSYYIPVSARSYLSLATGSAFHIVRYDGTPCVGTSQYPAMICLGGHDPYQTVSISDAFEILKNQFSEAQLTMILTADHHFHQHENELIEMIAQWINTR